MPLILATIQNGLVIGVCVFVVCIILIYMLFFRGKMLEAATEAKALMAPENISDSDYEIITERLLQIEDKYKTVLFAAASLKCLPITIPVNVGVSLAEISKKCLLIDMDIKRNAIAKAFEIDERAGSQLDCPRAHKTSFENLRLWPAHNFEHKNALTLDDVIKGAKNEFDFIIISAPYLSENERQKQIAAASDCAFIFAGNTEEATKLSSIMKPTKCKIIGNVKIATK